MDDGDAAVAALERLGLTEYEAKCFVALSRVPSATAKELSQLADVPRSRVYDTVERLHKRGVVDIQQSEPREFRAISKDAAIERLRQEYRSDLDAADRALEQVEAVESPEEKGIWAIANADHVIERATTLIDDADEFVHFLVTEKNVLERPTLDRLAAAGDRGVTIVVEVPSEAVGDHIRQHVPSARVTVSEGLGETHKVVEKWPGQLLMVDHRAVLASGIEESELPGVTKETAVWTPGRDHGAAAWIRELLEDRPTRTEERD